MKKESKPNIKQLYKANYDKQFKDINNQVHKLYEDKHKLEAKAIKDLVKQGMYLKDTDSNDYYKVVKEDKQLKVIVLTGESSIRVNLPEWELDLSALVSISEKTYNDRLTSILEYIVSTLK
jgi:hypothetical protein